MEHQSSPTPHVLIFPLPIQGHITPMLNLAELLCLANLKVTFLNTTQNHKLLTQNTNIEARFARYPGFVFSIVPDGIADERPRAGVSKFKDWSSELVEKLALSGDPLLREMLVGSTGIDKVTCLIIDGWISFANEVANEVKVPVIAFRCSSPCYMWTYFCIPKLIQAGDIPFKALGHITPMLHLAELLCIANFKVTFLNTTHNHQRLTQHADVEARFDRYPGFEFKTIPDGLPDDHPRTGENNINDWLKEVVQGLTLSATPFLREILLGSSETAKKTCLIVDGWMSFANDIANEAEIPVIIFKCASASCNWSYYCIPKLIEASELPFKDEAMDELVKSSPGMDSFLRYRDLPSFCRNQDTSSCQDLLHLFNGEIQRNKQAHAFILNTFEDLEDPTLSLIRSECSKVYTLGPLHAHLKYKLSQEETTLCNNSSSNLWEVDQSCISWLDQKPIKSVVYVSFGSLTILTKDQLREFWAGLVHSKKYFLWVIRPNLIIGSELDNPTPDDLLEGTKKRGCLVKWAPQQEVLAHRAIGGFLTHSGWNSTLESIVAGVPMLCWPYFADQQVNSRFVSEVWRIGLDMKDTCDRAIVEKMINDLMDVKKDELQRSMDKISQLAKTSISEGGSSYSNLNQLIEDIKAMSKKGER